MVRRKTVKKKTTNRSTKSRKKKQSGGALFKRKGGTLQDKIAEGVAMGLSGPSPTFLKLFAKMGSQVAKGVKDNVDYYKKRNRR